MVVARVGNWTTVFNASTSSLAATNPQSPTANNTQILHILSQKTGAAISDPGGLTGWSKRASVSRQRGTVTVQIWVYARINAGGDAAPTVTTSAATALRLSMSEWSGLSTTLLTAGIPETWVLENGSAVGNVLDDTQVASVDNEFVLAFLSGRAGSGGLSTPISWDADLTSDAEVADDNRYLYTATGTIASSGGSLVASQSVTNAQGDGQDCLGMIGFAPAPPPPKTGTASGAWEAAGTVTGEREPKGAPSGAWDVAGTVTGEKEPKGAPSGAWEVAGTVQGEREPKGLATGAWEVSGTVTGEADYEGAVTGAVEWAGTVSGEADYEGAVTGAWEVSGQVLGEKEPKGAVTGGVEWSGVVHGDNGDSNSVNGAWEVDGTVQGEANYQGDVDGAVEWAGTVTGEREPVGAVIGAVEWDGTVTGEREPVGAVTGGVEWAGSVVGVSEHKGSVSGGWEISGSMSGMSDVPSVPRTLSATIKANRASGGIKANRASGGIKANRVKASITP